MEMNVKVASPIITGVLTNVASAKKPQDFEITPSNEDITITAAEGYFIRSVTVKAMPSSEETGGNENDDNGADSGNTD